MTKHDYDTRTRQNQELAALGFTETECSQLRRASWTLRRWFEKECGIGNGCIERDMNTRKCFWYNSIAGKRSPAKDLETGARNTVLRIINEVNGRSLEKLRKNANGAHRVEIYVQTDPRGAAIYVLTGKQIADAKLQGLGIDSIYNRGICVF